MKKNIVILLLFLCLFSLVSVPAQMPVFDPTNWLVAIDQLFTSYDMVMNTIEQIEQAYEQYQYLIEQAKSWDFENIEWDGDWDFRDEIGDIASSVNKQITNIKRIEELFSVKQYSIGGMAFTVKDLVGAGDSDKALDEILRNVGEVSKDSFARAADALVSGIDQVQAMAIWRKYGLSPKDFIYMQQKKQLLYELSEKFIAAATDEAVEAQTEMNLQGANIIVSEALNKNKEHTEKELQQQIILMINELVKNLNSLGIKIDQTTSLTAWQQVLEDEKERQKKEAKIEQLQETKRPKIDTIFLF